MATSNSFALDNRNGGLVGAKLHLEEDEFVFTPGESQDAPAVLSEAPTPGEETYLTFASLEDESAKETGNTEGDAFESRFVSKLFDFAKSHGPLFGFAGLEGDGGRAEIREPVSDWIAAQSVMGSILKLIAFASGDDFPHANFDDRFMATTKCTENALTWAYTFITSQQVTELYASCLKEDFYTPFTTGDGTILSFSWSANGVPPWFLEQFPLAFREAGEAGSIFAAALQVYPAESYPDVTSTARGQASMPLSKLRDYREIREEAGTLLKIVAERHTGGISFGYRNYWDDCGDDDDGSYGVVSSCLLSYMWHELAKAYTNNQFRKCANPKCNAIISLDRKTKSDKRYCTEECRKQANNLKNSAQCARAREAFYQLKSFEEIYEIAYGEPYSFKDPKRKAHEKTLERWIEKDFGKTKKGQVALKQGAGRRRT